MSPMEKQRSPSPSASSPPRKRPRSPTTAAAAKEEDARVVAAAADEEEKKEEDSPAATAAAEVVEEEKEHESPASAAAEEEKGGDGAPAGYIFMCSGETKGECYRHRVLGLPRGRLADVSRIKRGTALFLFDFTSRRLHGPYRADSDGGLSLVPAAFHGRYPAQVKFVTDGDFMPIPESSLKSAIKENYSKGKFYPELTLAQVERLRTLFRPITILPKHAIAQYVDDRHPAPHAVYMPRASHSAQPAAYVHHPTSCVPRTDLHQTSYVPPTALHPTSYGSTALLVQPDDYAQYAQLPPPMAYFTTPAYVSAMGSLYQAAYTAYGPLPSTYQYVQVPPSHFNYAQQSSSGHVSAPGYSTDSYYAPHRYGTHQVDTVGSYYSQSTSESAAATKALVTNLQLVRSYGSIPSSVAGTAHLSELNQSRQPVTWTNQAVGTASAVYCYGGAPVISQRSSNVAPSSVYAVMATPACQ